jgi:hypothetical protein
LPRLFIVVTRSRPDPPSREMAHFASVANGGEKTLHPVRIGGAVSLDVGMQVELAPGREQRSERSVLSFHEFVP